MRHSLHTPLIAVMLGLGLILTACNKNAPAQAQSSNKSAAGKSGKPQTVSTTLTRVESVPLVLQAQGNVLALDEVELRPQKNGTIKEVLVREGSEVKKGQLLFTLDDRDDRANVDRAAAAVDGAQAALSIAKRDLARTQDLSSRNFVSPSALDSARNKVESSEAGVAQAKAALEQAKVSLSYTRIEAPFDGRAGRVDIRPGALVTASATQVALVKITRMHPIGVNFSLPENNLPMLLDAQRKGPVKVSATIDGTHILHGAVSFIDSSVDHSSGTIALKATLDNSERRVWPGQYVTVSVEAGDIPDATALPSQAVINGPNGPLVYVVQPDSTVAAQPISVVRIVDQNAIIKGVAGGVRVVLEGGQNLRPGVKIVDTGNGNGARGKRGGKAKDGQSAPAAEASAK